MQFQVISYLLEYVKAKLLTDAQFLDDERLLSVTLDEVIIFVKQINFIYPGYFELNQSLNPLKVFFDHSIYFDRILALERKRRFNSTRQKSNHICVIQV